MKVEMIKRKKPEGVAAEYEAKQASGEAALSSAKQISKKRQREKREAERWQKGHPGLRRVYFVIETELWDRFVQVCCATHKPNDVFTRMIYEAVQAKTTSSGEPN